MRWHIQYSALLLLWLLSQTSLAYAQIQALPQISADRIEERLPENLRKNTLPPALDIPLIEGIPEQESLIASESPIAFQVDNIVVLNNTVFDNELLHEKVKSGIGENVTLTDLRQAALNITNLYREEGYPFSRAYIPKQKLENNTVVIDIIEGYVGEVEYRGIEVAEDSAIHHYAQALLGHRPVKRDDLERYTLLINDLKGISARALMSLIKDEPGAVKLILLIDKHTHEAGMSINNRGSESLGPMQTSLYYKHNDLLEANEETSLIHLFTPGTNELSYFSFSQSFPIGSEGAKITYSLRRSDSNPGGDAAAFDIESESNSVNIDLTYPVIRTRKENLYLSAIFDSRNSSTETFDAEIIDDHLRVIRAKIAYNRIHDGGISDFEAIFSKGLNIISASPENSLKISRTGSSATASKIQVKASRKQVITDKTMLTVKGTWQWGHERLFSAELFGLGGSEYGRAFDFSTITGDTGYALSAELRYKIPHDINNLNRFDIYGFIDGGQAYDETNIIGKNWQGLSTAGFGLDLTFHKLLNLKFEMAQPIKIESDSRDYNLKAYGTIGVKFTF